MTGDVAWLQAAQPTHAVSISALIGGETLTSVQIGPYALPSGATPWSLAFDAPDGDLTVAIALAPVSATACTTAPDVAALVANVNVSTTPLTTASAPTGAFMLQRSEGSCVRYVVAGPDFS